jgi:hypothetical protein
MKARDPRYGNGRRVALRTRVGIAATAATLAGGGAFVAVAATSHGGATAAQSAGYAYSSPGGSEWNSLNSAMNNWGSSEQSSYTQLAQLTQVKTYSQTWQHNQMLVAQRGIVVLATQKFLILKSADGSLHLWLLSGHTKFKNVSSDNDGMWAMTGNSSATDQAMNDSNMGPATDLLAGSMTNASQLVESSASAQTAVVDVANTDLKVTVVVTSATAEISQTASMPWSGMPSWSPISYRQDAWQQYQGVARGDLALVVGTRSDWTLKAKLVLFAPLSSSDMSGGSNNGYSSGSNEGYGNQGGGVISGTHS